MKRIFYFIAIFLFICLYFTSPYIIDHWQKKNSLQAAGAIAVYEGAKSVTLTKCQPSCYVFGVATCCVSANGLCLGNSIPPACLDYEMTVNLSAGGLICPAYFVTFNQQPILNGSTNMIWGGSSCTNLSVVASEKGCLGCGY
jgi:hypothetical protein